MYKRQAPASTFLVTVTGRGSLAGQGGTHDLITRAVKAAFTPFERMRLDIALDRVCLQVACDSAGAAAKLTCSGGLCEAVPTIQLSLAGDGPLGGFVNATMPDAGAGAQARRDPGRAHLDP